MYIIICIRNYILTLSTTKSIAFIKKPLQIFSINELGITAVSSENLDKGASFEFGGFLFNEIGTVNTIVEDCVKVNEYYKINLSFVGLTEEKRKKIRLLCREIWTESKKEKQQEGESS